MKKTPTRFLYPFWAVPALLLWATPVSAAEMSCDQLIKILGETGENPAIAINPAKETVTLKTSRGFCVESIHDWSKRPPLPSNVGQGPARKPAPAKKPVAPPGTVPPSAPKEAAPLPVLQKPVDPPPCRYQVGEAWGSLTVKIEGIDHWLVRAFTMDLDGDRIIDNVNFVFKGKDNSIREIQYFSVANEVPGNAYPALKLRDESVIQRLCFGQQNYEMPEFFGEKAEPTWIEIDKLDLAAEKEARDKGVSYVRPSQRRKDKAKKEGTNWLLGLGVFFVMAIVLGGGGYWLYAMRRKKQAGEDEEVYGDGEEEEDGEEKPEKKKKGLGGLLDRFKRKKKKKTGDDGDDNDDDDDD